MLLLSLAARLPSYTCSVDRVKGIRLELVTTPEQIKIWNTLLKYDHYLGPRMFFGRQNRYLVVSDHGYLGAAGFSCASKSSRPRDEFIGWTLSQRRSLLVRVALCMCRLCIRRSVLCRSLATKVVSMSLESLRKDFPAKYGYCPCVVETFVDPEQDLAGICYRASSWDELGLTSGRGRNAADWKPNRNRKLIFLYTLDPGFREKFGFQPLYPKWNHPLFSRKGALPVDSPVSLAEWPALEYGACSMGHDDRNRRAAIIAQDIGRAVDRPYPDAAGGDRNRINAYYFTESGQEKVSFDSILSGTVECTWRRAMGTDLVRILQDGTVLNLDGLQKLDGLGVVGTNQTETLVRGLHLHTGLASDRQGRRLGVAGAVLSAPEWVDPERESAVVVQDSRRLEDLDLDQECADLRRVRIVDAGHAGRRGRRQGVRLFGPPLRSLGAPAHRKLDARLPRPQACRRILFAVRAHAETGGRRHGHRRRLEAERSRQAFGLQAQKGKSGQKGRAGSQVRQVRINPPPERQGEPPLALQCLSVTERFKGRRPRNVEAIDWKLLTNLPVNSFEDAAAVVEHYAALWKIEEWHRILKHGCRVEALTCGSRRSLDRVLAFRVSESARLMRALDLGRTEDSLPPEVVFTEREIEVLQAQAERKASES